MKKILVLFSLAIALALPGANVMAYNSVMAEVNGICGYDVTAGTDCESCHYGNVTPTSEQTLYLTDGACGFCPEITDCISAPPTDSELLAAAQQTTNAYFETLFKEFMMHMMMTGMMNPDGSINNPNIFAEVFPSCPQIAPVIASDFSRQTGYLVRRVTTKTRNSRSTPDAWELNKLQKFEQMAADGDPRTQFDITKPDGSIMQTREFEAYEIVVEGDERGRDRVRGAEPKAYFRYMRSITMPGLDKLPCLKCHGSDAELGPGVQDAINLEYPYDLAMYYMAGDIRGAWTIKIPLAVVPQ